MLTGKVKEKYQTGKGYQGLIIDVDNPKFKFPLKAYDNTNELGVGDIQVGQSVEFDWEKTDFGNTMRNFAKFNFGNQRQKRKNKFHKKVYKFLAAKTTHSAKKCLIPSKNKLLKNL